MEKCDLCFGNRYDNLPDCVKNCPVQALQVVDLDEHHGGEQWVPGFVNTHLTNPNIRIRKIRVGKRHFLRKQ